jgi:ATP-dependent exoDNAse (exonuclease V) beta subunit
VFGYRGIIEILRSNIKGIQWAEKKGYLFRGGVDNFLVKGMKLVFLDYKTAGYPHKEDTHEHYQY